VVDEIRPQQRCHCIDTTLAKQLGDGFLNDALVVSAHVAILSGYPGLVDEIPFHGLTPAAWRISPRTLAAAALVRICAVIEVLDYDPRWAERFEVLRAEYAGAMASAGVPVVAIEHVGSTSVPGLAAKPTIDCDIVVERSDVDAASDVLVSLGFQPRGELGIPERWAFYEPARLKGTNTYVIVAGSLSLKNHLAVRDALRANEALRDEYAAVKKRVGATAGDLYEYGAGKNSMVQLVLEAAGISDAERASIDGNQVPQTSRPARDRDSGALG
jgi:GrpB-like predicted nucleotidyltransferase (UPF0157 family)